MDRQASESTVVEMAEWLGRRKNQDHRTVLFLGARTGGLFRSQKLYELSRRLGNPSFSGLSTIDQFGECYKAIKKKSYGPTDLHVLLREALEGLKPTKADECLAELVKYELFDAIISTNIDDLLERALNSVDMRAPHNFQVRSPKRYTPPLEVHRTCTLVQAFGDLQSQEYRTIGAELYLNVDKELKKDLESHLERDILMIGFDPVWDEEIGDLFPKEGSSFWYVNEQPAQENSLISKALRYRQGSRYAVGTHGSYDTFIQQLHSCIMGRGPLNYEVVREMVNQLQEIREISVQIRGDISGLQAALQELLTSKRES